MPKLPDNSEQLAQRLHCLTCLLSEAVERMDGSEIQALFSERGKALEELTKLEITSKASSWLDKTAALEVETLAAWKEGQDRLAKELISTSRTSVKLNEYKRQRKAA